MTRVLAVRLDNEGDVLLAGPALRALAAGADRRARRCGPRGQQAAGGLPGGAVGGGWRGRPAPTA